MTPRENRPGPGSPRRRPAAISRIEPAYDTGITIGHRRHRSRRRRSLWPTLALVIGLAVVLGGLAFLALQHPAAAPVAASSVTTATASVTSTPSVPVADPTPMFATYRSLTLRLPVNSADVTAIAFHQASGDKALHMTALVDDADMTQAAKHRAVPRSTLASGSADASAPIETVWSGEVLRLWRSNRRGKPDTAVDIGANAGTDVYAPITGTVLAVRAYKLYSKYPDYEIHIRPDGWPEVDVVLIHVDDVSIIAGERVVAGASRIACVRKMSDKVDLQLGGYTKNGGDHVHVQLNPIDVPGKLERLNGS